MHAGPPRGGGGGRNSGTGSGLPYYIWMPAVAGTGLVAYSYFAFLEEVPLTHRKRWIATSPQWEQQLGRQEYQKMLQEFRNRGQVLPPNHRASVTVQRVGSNLAQAAQQFAHDHNLPISKSPYTYTVIRSDMANAFVLPENHVFVFTGLFKYIQNEDDLAAVLAHEMSHNLARHAGEKMSGSFVVNLFAGLSFVVDPSGFLYTVFVPAASLLRDLPHSRTQETEADQIGVYLAAQACYDPRAAKRVFAAMKNDATNENKAPPEFLSTHPSHDTRISNFDTWLPDAMKVYHGDGDSYLGSGSSSSESSSPRCRHVREQMKEARNHAAYRAVLREQQ